MRSFDQISSSSSPVHFSSYEWGFAFLRRDESIEEDFYASIPYGYDAEALEAAREVDREQGLQQYAELKKRMLARTRRFGTLLSGYLLLQVSASVSLLAWPSFHPLAFHAFSGSLQLSCNAFHNALMPY